MKTISLLSVWFGFTVLLAAGRAESSASSDGFTVDADFPGGNIQVVRTEPGRFILAPDLRDTQTNQWWFFFNVRLRGPAGSAVELAFAEKKPIGVRGPAVSTDAGLTWRWLGAEAVKSIRVGEKPGWSFTARIPAQGGEVRYAFCPEYLQAHLDLWRQRHSANPALRVEELCRSRKGRPVELLRAGCLDDRKSPGMVLLTSRHHCCEAMATYAMEGFLETVLGTNELARQWQSHWQVVALPFMDKDGVEAGDQGKNRHPHDHNRDYNAAPLYPEVAALMRLGQEIKARVVASVDLHCPYISGTWNDRAYMVGCADPGFAARQRALADRLEQTRRGPVPFTTRDCLLEFGKSWNTAGNFSQGRSSSAWARDTFTSARVVTTFELAYADAQSVEVNAESARAFGADVARALAAQLSAP
ncbi:MAG: hypothetical protein WCO56_27380 [Verrucomicrobiota bacterium]